MRIAPVGELHPEQRAVMEHQAQRRTVGPAPRVEQARTVLQAADGSSERTG